MKEVVDDRALVAALTTRVPADIPRLAHIGSLFAEDGQFGRHELLVLSAATGAYQRHFALSEDWTPVRRVGVLAHRHTCGDLLIDLPLVTRPTKTLLDPQTRQQLTDLIVGHTGHRPPVGIRLLALLAPGRSLLIDPTTPLRHHPLHQSDPHICATRRPSPRR